LDLLSASTDVGFFTGSQLVDWYAAAAPASDVARSS
jgi:allantoinase